ncbi:alpha/beta-hydrolase [Pyrenochaeta sp. DS3sAY3a]|nr:alpha/beta-hydrolase [Pyrenochaeta sp. DS3sAY3a]
MTIQHFVLSNFTFKNGTTLPQVRVAYKILNLQNTKIAVVHTCFRGRIDSTVTHAEGALKNHRIIIIALFGNGESSSPSNTPNFPSTIEYTDCVEAQHRLLTEELDIPEIDVMLGFSMGGQITYHWLASHPSYIKNAVIVCSSAKTSLHNIQFLEGPKAALQNARDEASGIRAFGKAYSAWLTSAEWFDRELYRDIGFDSLAAWDATAAGRNYSGWAGEDLLVMLGMWQRGDAARCVPDAKGDLEVALRSIEARVLLMPCETDQYFRPYVSEREVKSLRRGKVAVVRSVWGHIIGGGASREDTQWMDESIETFLRD